MEPWAVENSTSSKACVAARVPWLGRSSQRCCMGLPGRQAWQSRPAPNAQPSRCCSFSKSLGSAAASHPCRRPHPAAIRGVLPGRHPLDPLGLCAGVGCGGDAAGGRAVRGGQPWRCVAGTGCSSSSAQQGLVIAQQGARKGYGIVGTVEAGRVTRRSGQGTRIIALLHPMARISFDSISRIPVRFGCHILWLTLLATLPLAALACLLCGLCCLCLHAAMDSCMARMKRKACITNETNKQEPTPCDVRKGLARWPALASTALRLCS